MEERRDIDCAEDLPILKQFSKHVDKSIKEFFIYTRFGEFIDRMNVQDAIMMYGHRKVFNFYNNGPGQMTVYICCKL